jgi:hypothetical protein
MNFSESLSAIPFKTKKPKGNHPRFSLIGFKYKINIVALLYQQGVWHVKDIPAGHYA